MSEKKIKQTRRASKHVQREFIEMNLPERERAVREKLKSAFFHIELRRAMEHKHFTAFTPPDIQVIVERLLIAEGFNLTGLVINVSSNPITGALLLQCDASSEAQQLALARAKQRLAAGTIGR